ncbi:hypothetical protein [[Eubacterium] cellulosolvens]
MPLYEKRHSNHEKHLCSMVTWGAALSEYKELVKNPKFICMECGRLAAKEENLCEPIPL